MKITMLISSMLREKRPLKLKMPPEGLFMLDFLSGYTCLLTTMCGNKKIKTN